MANPDQNSTVDVHSSYARRREGTQIITKCHAYIAYTSSTLTTADTWQHRGTIFSRRRDMKARVEHRWEHSFDTWKKGKIPA
jgi:hypothetical protein